MKNIIINVLIFITFTASWPALANGPDQVADSASANVVIFRPNDGSAINYRISVDGEYVGKLRRDSAINLQLQQGDHIIAVNDAKRTTLTVVANTQEVTYVHTNIGRKSQLSLTIVEPSSKLVASLSR